MLSSIYYELMIFDCLRNEVDTRRCCGTDSIPYDILCNLHIHICQLQSERCIVFSKGLNVCKLSYTSSCLFL